MNPSPRNTAYARTSSPARLGDHVESLLAPDDAEDREFAVGPRSGLENDWMRRAACLESEPEVFFPPGPSAVDHINEAKAVCEHCPVVADCLRVALADPTLVGVWGGTSEDQRHEIRRARGRVELRSLRLAHASSAAAGSGR